MARIFTSQPAKCKMAGSFFGALAGLELAYDGLYEFNYAEEFLRAIQAESSLYGLTLNFTKTELLTHPQAPPGDVHYVNGDPVVHSEEVRKFGIPNFLATPRQSGNRRLESQSPCSISQATKRMAQWTQYQSQDQTLHG